MAESYVPKYKPKGEITIKVSVSPQDVFTPREIFVLTSILRGTPREEIGKHYSHTAEWVDLMVSKLLWKIEEEQ